MSDADLLVEDESKTGPQWAVWRHSYPHREADARKYLRYERTSHGLYWYVDARDGCEYAMPELAKVRAYNRVLVLRQDKADARRIVRKRVAMATGMFLFLTLVLLPIIPSVAPWLWLGLPLVVWLAGKVYGREPKLSYAKLTDLRYDEFLSDEEIQDRHLRRVALVATLGLAVAWLWWRHRD